MANWRDEKLQYKRHKARRRQVPVSYHEAIEAVERYALRFGPVADETVTAMLEDLAEIFEQTTKEGALVREIVGKVPVQFDEGSLKDYPANPWVAKEQQRVAHTINRAARAEV